METLSVKLTPEMLALVPAVAVLLQVLKKIPILDKIKSWFPFVSIGIALGLSYATSLPDPILSSIIIGLTASGAYDLVKGSKTTIK